MATESPVRISGSVDRWQALNDPLVYRTSAVEMAIEGLDFSILKDEKSQSLEEETVKLSKNKLRDYEEEFEDDGSCDRRSIVPAQKSDFSDSHKGSLDSMQDKNPATSPATQIGPDYSPLYEQLTGKNNGQAPPQDITTACLVQEASSRALHPAIIHAYTASQSPFYHNFPPAGFFGPGGYHTLLPPYLAEYPETFYGRVGVPLQLQPPLHVQYLQPPLRASYSPFGVYSHFNYQMGFYGSKKEPPCYGSHYYGSPTHDGAFRQFPEASVVRPAMRSKLEAKTRLSHSSGDVSRARNDESLSYFLEEVKSGNGQRLELSDIEGYVVEFSVDQHGSRFVQQKLAICSLEEKASIFKEISPHASKLITDVFGNYVVQKLFEHGSWEERKNLADQLTGKILPLSMQMYGCRVIQKALDVIDLEQKTRLVRELDGHVLRCVRDQNGNHVIQKCIDSIPIDDIRFVVSSFRGHVASLSMHPYGCRVIQRFLEHFNGNAQTKFIMDEILDSVCSLAQDRYGNYVTQHALERGTPHERSRIVEKLLGCIVQMSRHKFASNVVEKCVEYCDSDAIGMLIEEISGDCDNLLVMMKDRYANYVVQTILEKCSTEHREVLLGRIRSHLTVLKKYTYGKHIVSRFEKLCGDG